MGVEQSTKAIANPYMPTWHVRWIGEMMAALKKAGKPVNQWTLSLVFWGWYRAGIIDGSDMNSFLWLAMCKYPGDGFVPKMIDRCVAYDESIGVESAQDMRRRACILPP